MQNFKILQMKRIIILSISMICMMLTSCNDTLDLNPLDKISTATFWNKKADFDQALTAIYGQRRDPMFTADMV
jgi:hypothetical protein